MASITTDSRGLIRIMFIDTDGKRRAIALGRMHIEMVQLVKSRVESLLAAKKLNRPPFDDDDVWLGRIGSVLYERLAKFGLVGNSSARDRAGFVYFIQAGDAGPIKIGFSSKVDIRIDALQKANAEKLNLLATISGTLIMEAELHQRFAEHRIRGEWFRPAAELLAAIQMTFTE